MTVPDPLAELVKQNNIEWHQDRRFKAACAAMQGLLAGGNDGWRSLHEKAVHHADALLSELAKGEPMP